MTRRSRSSSTASSTHSSLDSSNFSQSSTTSNESYTVQNEICDNLVNDTPDELLTKIIHHTQDIENNNNFDDLSKQLHYELDQMVNYMGQISSFACDYDYKGIPANGYRTILRLFTRMLDITSRLTSKRHRMEQFSDLINNFNRILGSILDLRQQELLGIVDEKAHRILLSDMFRRSSDIMKITLNCKYLSMSIPKYKWLLKLFLRFTAMVAPTASPSKRIKARNFDQNASLFLDTVLNTKLTRLATYFRLLDMPISRSFASLLRSAIRPVDCSVKRFKKYQVPSHYQIRLSATGTQLVRRTSPLIKEAKFSIIKNTTPDPAHPDDLSNNQGKVLVYLHGGSFVGPSASSLENLFIKDFASASRNLTLINFDYPLCPEHRFPVALELLLDFYLWLTNYSDVKKVIGFEPKQIIVSGDSSGANLAAALIVLLNDIRRNPQLTFEKIKPKMPSSLALFMPKMVIKLQVTPSLIYTLFDPILSGILLLRAGEMYMPIRKKDPQTGKWKLVTGRRKKVKRSVIAEDPIDADDQEIHEDIPNDYVSRLEYEFVPSVYHSPLDYPHLNELSDIKLAVLSTTFDPLMDESIEVVRKWPGPSSLHVVDPSFHGMYGASLIMPKTTANLMEACNSVIRDACMFTDSSSET